MKILVVDDSELEQVRLRALLERLGHQVLIAADGVDALEAFVVAGPDLILLDVMMPVMDGLETARRIRELHLPWVPIVFLSSNVEPEDIASGIEAGGDDYLSKPVHGVVLAAKLRAMERIAAMKNLISQVAAPDLKAEIAELAAVDRRSGLATEQAGKTMLAREFVRCSRTVQSLSLLLVSVDGYEDLLAEHGEEIADGCIRSLTVALQSNASRISDFIARHGDAAFLIVMPDTPMTGAVRVGERVRSTINDLESAHSLEGRTPLPHFTVSVGVATAIPQNGNEAQQLELAVDAMLNQAQSEGGNRVHATAADVPFRLTARELECLQWSAIGKSSWEISSILNISESAVNFHMANIRSKFNVGSRRQAVVQAIRFGLIRAS